MPPNARREGRSRSTEIRGDAIVCSPGGRSRNWCHGDCVGEGTAIGRAGTATENTKFDLYRCFFPFQERWTGKVLTSSPIIICSHAARREDLEARMLDRFPPRNAGRWIAALALALLLPACAILQAPEPEPPPDPTAL